MSNLILVRHGESTWNKENRFTGWQDVDLSEQGVLEANSAGETIKNFLMNEKMQIHHVYCSVLKRALRTLNQVLYHTDLMWLPVTKDWRLNERHYGALTGLNKAETAAKHGEEQVKVWRRSYDIPPPSLEVSDQRHPRFDQKYQGVPEKLLPLGESLKDTVNRFLPLWNDSISPQLQSGKNILIVAHGNSLRALIQNLEKMSAEEILELNIPTGVPLYYKLDSDLKIKDKKYLADQKSLDAALEKVKNQGKSK